MYLSELNILGFKSFAKKTNIVFHDGTTAIVGPNGCGKSNIVDAIRWVLGEQKSGVLRSDRMENVIFNGSRSAKAVGMAEVSLKVENTKNLLPVEYSQVVITRRLFRSGESQYLINGNVCRLKDITNLFVDTGMGSHAYSVIELSMVESILNGKPEERRRILEEAAGITRYKLRRNATFRKLEATEKDLIRIDDIMAEVEKSVRALYRQVQKAKSYQKLNNHLQELETQIADYEYSLLMNELEPLITKKDLVKNDKESLIAELAKKEAESEDARARLIQTDQKLAEMQKNLNNLNNTLRNAEEQILVNEERIKSFESAIERFHKEEIEAKARITDLDEEVKELSEKEINLKDELEVKEKEYSEQREQYEQELNRFKTQRDHIQLAEQKLFDLTEQLSQKRTDIQRFVAFNEGLEQRLQQMDSDEIQSNKRSEELYHLMTEKEHSLQYHQEKKNNIEQNINVIVENITRSRKKFDDLKEGILVTQNQIQALTDQTTVLKRMLDTLEDYPEGIRFLAHQKREDFNSIGPLPEIIKVKPEHRKAIAIALDGAHNYLVVEDIERAVQGLSLLKNDKHGRVSFLPLHQINPGKHESHQVAESEIIGWANEMVACEERFQPIFDSMLSRVLVVSNIETARRLLPRFSEQTIDIVTLDGDFFSHWGMIRGGEQNDDQTEIVGRKDHIANLEKQINNLLTEKTQHDENLKNLENEISTLLETQANSEDLLKSEEHEIAKCQIELAQVHYEVESLEKATAKRLERREQLKTEISANKKQIDRLNSLIIEMESNRLKLKENLKESRTLLNDLERRTSSKSAGVHAKNVEVVTLQGEHQAIQQQLESIRKQIQELGQLAESRGSESKKTLTDIQSLRKKISETSVTMKADMSRRDKLTSEIEVAQEEQYQINTHISQIDVQLRELRSKTDQTSEELHRMEMLASELSLKAENTTKRIYREFEYNVQRVEIPSDLNLEPIQKEIEATRYKLKNIGAVNLLALKEYEQEKERYDFLRTQRDDLFAAKQNLNNTIDMINETARTRFIETFEIIQQNFSKVFQNFFDGGQASLVIRGGGDPLEEGIDILATPGGKRLQSLTLMSGGEKTLTAISLLFAIYLVKPSPFCILDEVDAPLDDQNVRRFTSAITEFSQNTQFIVVTHNKLTMRSANQLYGITMEQEGVSKVVSVKFDRQKEPIV